MPAVQPGRPAAVWAALGIVYVIWGSTYLAIRFSLETMPPLLSAGARFFVAGSLMAAVLVVRRPARPTRRQARNAALCGVLVLVGGNGMVVLAETHIASGLAALLVACVPLWLVVLRRLIGQRVPTPTYFGVAIGLVGVAVLFARGGGGSNDPRYAALVVLAALSWSGGSLLATRIDVPGEPAVLSTVEMLTAGVTMVVIAGLRGEWGRLDVGAISAKSWWALGYLVVFGSVVAFSAYIWLFGHAPTSLVATYAYVNPAVAVVLGALLDHERLTLTELLGGAVILVAVVLVVGAERVPRASEGEPEPERR